MKKDAFDVQHPFFIPLYRRIIVVVMCLGWAVFETINGHMLFAVLFGAAGLWCAHQFFVAFDPKPIDDDNDDEKGDPK